MNLTQHRKQAVSLTPFEGTLSGTSSGVLSRHKLECGVLRASCAYVCRFPGFLAWHRCQAKDLCQASLFCMTLPASPLGNHSRCTVLSKQGSSYWVLRACQEGLAELLWTCEHETLNYCTFRVHRTQAASPLT